MNLLVRKTLGVVRPDDDPLSIDPYLYGQEGYPPRRDRKIRIPLWRIKLGAVDWRKKPFRYSINYLR